MYGPRSAVFHSHERGFVYDLRRPFVGQHVLSELFGLRPAANLGGLLLAVPRSSLCLYLLLRRDKEAAKRALRPALLATRYALAAQVGAYLGLHAGVHRHSSKGV